MHTKYDAGPRIDQRGTGEQGAEEGGANEHTLPIQQHVGRDHIRGSEGQTFIRLSMLCCGGRSYEVSEALMNWRVLFPRSCN